MGKFFSRIGKEIRLGFKTVIFNFKQYFCFYIAIIAMLIMFGIIVMSSSNNIYQRKIDTEKSYKYHFTMTNLPEDGVEHFTGLKVNGYDIEKDGNFIRVYIDKEYLDEGGVKSYEYYFDEFVDNHVKPVKFSGDFKSKDVNYEMSPLYTLKSDINSLRLECAVKLFVLALVAIAVIILLFNIRLNHFKFTYGIYMSFGADTKKLFSTSFWEMMVIGLLMIIPAGAISTFASRAFYMNYADMELKYHFAPWLMLYALLYIIPVFAIAIFIPIKYTASKPPLHLLLAEDNSNLVSSPRISTRLVGKRFPKAYEGLGLWRFRRYCATVVASSVLFSSIFVWITFFKDIYGFNTNQMQAEFTIEAKYEEKEVETYETPDEKDWNTQYDVTDDLKKERQKVYKEYDISIGGDSTRNKIVAFEKFFVAKVGNYPKYKVTFEGDHVTMVEEYQFDDSKNPVMEGNKHKLVEVWAEFETARNVLFKSGVEDKDTKDLYELLDTVYYHHVVSEESGYISKVIKKKRVVEKQKFYNNIPLEVQRDLTSIAGKYDGDVQKLMTSDSLANYSYLALSTDNVKSFSGYELNFKNREQRVTTGVDYFAYTDEDLAYIANNYECVGGEEGFDKLNKTGEVNYCIISETAANKKVLDIKPGDTVSVMVRETYNAKADKDLSADDYLKELLDQEEKFREIKLTVAVVVKDMPTSTNLPIYVSASTYKAITGREPTYNRFSVYMEPTKSAQDITQCHAEIVECMSEYGNVVWNNAVEDNRQKAESQNLEVIQLIAVFALILSPLFWFFSQIMFYGKRSLEFSMLRGMGATEKEIKGIFKKDGRVISGLGVLATLLFSVLGVFLIHRFNMLFVARNDKTSRFLYNFEWGLFRGVEDGGTLELLKSPFTGDFMEGLKSIWTSLNPLWIALFAAVAVTFVCGYLSSLIPYYMERKRARKTTAKEFGEE